MPPRATAVTLGFVGTGEAAPESISALLDDFVKANGGKAKVILPATEDHWTPSIAAVADIATNNSWAIEVVTDDDSAKFKPIKAVLEAASKQHKATDTPAAVQRITDAAGGNLVVFYDETDETYAVLEAAADAGTAMYDICDGMQPLEMKTPEDPQEPEAPGGGDGEITEESLAAMTDVEIETLADELKIEGVDQMDTWNDVRAAILAHYQESGGSAPTSGGDDNPWPSREEIETEWEFDKLKAFAQANEIEIPANSRSSGYRKAILTWYDEAMANASALGDEEREFEGAPGDGGDLRDYIEQNFEKLFSMILNLDRGVTEGFTSIRESLQNGSRPAAAPAERPPGTTVKKASPPAAAPAKRTTAARPAVAAKKAATPPRTVGRR